MLRAVLVLLPIAAFVAGCPGFGFREPHVDGGAGPPIFDENVQGALEVSCGRCHGPGFEDEGAPMTFRLDRCEAQGEILGAKDVLPLILLRLFETPDSPMPPSDEPPMESADAQLLKAWEAAGAPCTADESAP